MTHGVEHDLRSELELEAVEDPDIAVAAAAVRRFLQGRVRDQSTVDDLTQETVARLLDVRHRLDRAASIPYAVTVAKHLMIAEARSAAVAQRHVHRLSDDPSVPAPDDLVLNRDDEVALRAALQALPEDERVLLLAHVVDGADTASLATRTGGTAAGVAAKLGRARARARVDYVLASNRATLPTTHCRSVLLSLSAADRRRQSATHAAEHLVGCSVCADLSPQLVERRRSGVALIPIPIVARLLGAARALLRTHPLASIGGAVGVVTVATVAVVASFVTPHRDTAAPPTSAPRTTVSAAPGPADLDVRTLVALPTARWPRLAGRHVVARAVPVLAVPADEGFWVGFSSTQRVWVQLATRNESSIHVVAGQRVTFRGELIRHGHDFAARVGVDGAEGARQLIDEGVHLSVKPSGLATSG